MDAGLDMKPKEVIFDHHDGCVPIGNSLPCWIALILFNAQNNNGRPSFEPPCFGKACESKY